MRAKLIPAIRDVQETQKRSRGDRKGGLWHKCFKQNKSAKGAGVYLTLAEVTG